MLDVGTEVVIVSLSFSVSQHLKQNLEHNYKRRVGQQVVAQSSTLPSDNEGLLWVIPTQRVAIQRIHHDKFAHIQKSYT